MPTSKLTKRYDGVKDVSDMPDITLKQIEHFFEHYKDLEPGKWVKIVRWGDAAEAPQDDSSNRSTGPARKGEQQMRRGLV